MDVLINDTEKIPPCWSLQLFPEKFTGISSLMIVARRDIGRVEMHHSDDVDLLSHVCANFSSSPHFERASDLESVLKTTGP